MGKLIRLEIQGEFNLGFSINAKIEEDSPLLSPSDNRLIAGITGKLADNLQLLEKYRDWQAIYRNVTTSFPTFPLQRRPSLTNVSTNIIENDFEPFKKQTNDLINSFNAWLKDEAFLPIQSLLRNHLNPNEQNRILLMTDNPCLRKLPWQEWDLLREFPKTETGFVSPNFKQVQQLAPTSKDGVKILAILGYQADVESQGQAMQNLGKNVEVTWLKQPKREELDEPLWKQSWDIIFFVGHGESGDEWKTGTIWINEIDKITISELRNHLKKAIENGLKLAILNCCDGLGLAHSLAEGEDLYLPQMIVMREELPVAVAPRFLQYFLEEFTQYNSLYASVREARQRLKLLEKDFPCVSWLPVVCQNPAEKPVSWQGLRGIEAGINWREVCQNALVERQRLTTNPLTTGDGVEFTFDDIYVPLGLVEKVKKEKCLGEVSPESGSQFYQPEEVTRTYKNDEFFAQVLKQGQSPKSQGCRLAVLDIFISYAYEDTQLKKELKKQLTILERQNLIKIFSYEYMIFQEKLNVRIHQNFFYQCRLILFLISPDFLASDFCRYQIDKAKELWEQKKAFIIPIRLRPVDDKEEWFSRLKPLPSNSKPLTKWENRDEAFVNITQGIRKAIEEMSNHQY